MCCKMNNFFCYDSCCFKLNRFFFGFFALICFLHVHYHHITYTHSVVIQWMPFNVITFWQKEDDHRSQTITINTKALVRYITYKIVWYWQICVNVITLNESYISCEHIKWHLLYNNLSISFTVV